MLRGLAGNKFRFQFRSLASASHGPVPFNEPGGSLFNRVKGEPIDWPLRIYIGAYIGGLAVFAYLWQFKPDSRAETWAREISIQRMKERGIDLSSLNL